MKRTILLADDSPTIQRLVEQTFQEGDFVVVSVSNGDAAVRKFLETRPSAVLADVFMPGRNGYEVCAFVREHPLLDRTPVILLVGAFEAFDEVEAQRVGADGKISKPFEPKELQDLVSSVVSAEEATQESVKESVNAPVGESLTPAGPEVSEQADSAPEASESEAVADLGVVADSEANIDSDADILGLRHLFPAIDPTPVRPALSEDELEAIADRVIERLSSEVIEGIAWEIVPDVAERVVREELKKQE